MNDIDLAKKELREKDLSLVIIKDGKILYSTDDYGVRGLMEAITKFSQDLAGSSVADKVVGKAAAMLCRYGGVKEIYAILISEGAVKALERSKILFEYEELVPVILNRKKNSQCPFETLTADCINEKECYEKIKGLIASMQ